MPRSNLNVVDEAVGANDTEAGVVERVGFVVDCMFGVDGCVLNVCAAIGVTFAVGIVDFGITFVPAAGFSVGVLLVAVGVSSSGILPVAAGVGAGEAVVLSSLCVGGFGKFNVFSDDFDCDIKENEGDFWTPPPNANSDDAAVPNIFDVSVLVPANENGLAVAAVAAVGVSNEIPLLFATLFGTLVPLVDFSTVAAPNPNAICDFSVFPKNDFVAIELIDDDGGGCCGCVAVDLVIVIVACFSVTSFGLNVVVPATCCGRINCVG